jgi:hypothetical protein
MLVPRVIGDLQHRDSGRGPQAVGDRSRLHLKYLQTSVPHPLQPSSRAYTLPHLHFQSPRSLQAGHIESKLRWAHPTCLVN